MNKLIILFLILLLSFTLYGAYKFDFGRKNFALINRYFPSYLIWPKNPDTFDRFYKIVIISSLVVFIILFVVFMVYPK